MKLARAIWERIPWVRRWRRRKELRLRSEILRWEVEHLPDDVRERIAEPLNIVTGRNVFSDDSLSIEMAADQICAALSDRTTAEDAFRVWFVTRYPFYAD
jgi:hypothetical protein